MNNITRSQAMFLTEGLMKQGIVDVSAANSPLMLSVCRAPGRSQEEIAHDICLDKSTVARSLVQLEERGYIVRIPKTEDKRCLLVYPTDKMYELIPSVRRIISDWYDHILEGVSDEELEFFHSVLIRLEQNARRATNHGGAKT
jgi:DNA-binding MarR family transcriptional regulator